MRTGERGLQDVRSQKNQTSKIAYTISKLFDFIKITLISSDFTDFKLDFCDFKAKKSIDCVGDLAKMLLQALINGFTYHALVKIFTY